jgi:hypothetical protein
MHITITKWRIRRRRLRPHLLLGDKMANFAVITNTVVSNIIVAKDLKTAESATHDLCIELTDTIIAGVGWTYIDGVFIAPPPIELVVENVEE